MDFEPTPEQLELQKAAQEFAHGELDSEVVWRDREGVFDTKGWQKCAGFGALGLPVPTEYGGMGLSLLDTIAVMEGLGYGARDQGLLFSINAHLWTSALPILTYGDEEQRRKYLPGLCNGKLIGANGSSEPEAGSDVFSMRSRAQPQGDYYILTGSKTFVSNAPIANLFVVYATVDPALGPMGITAFIIERDTPGFVIGRPLEKMGLRTSPMAEIAFDGCSVPLSNRLGREGRGVAVFESSMEWERGCILANYFRINAPPTRAMRRICPQPQTVRTADRQV